MPDDIDFQDQAIIIEALGRYRLFWEDEYHKELGKNLEHINTDAPYTHGPADIAKAKLHKTEVALDKIQRSALKQ